MKKSLLHLSAFILFMVLFLVSMFSFSGCSGGSIPGVVCDYGNVVCDISNTICRDIPGVPDEVCTYIDLACYNLNVLCQASPESAEYKNALLSLEFVTEKLDAWKYAKQH